MAGRNGLVLRSQAAYTHRMLPLATIAYMGHNNICVSSTWQRSPRWTKRDKTEFLTATLRNVPVPQLYLPRIPHDKRPLGNPEFYIIDGQNRIFTLAEYLHATHSDLTVRACDVQNDAKHIKLGMKFADFTTAQRKDIEQIQIPILELHDTVSDGELREIFRCINKMHPVNAAERVHSWIQLTIVSNVLNKVEEDWRQPIHTLRPRWRAKNHGLIIIFAHIMAMTDGQNATFLPTSTAVENWVAQTETRTFTPVHAQRLNKLIQAAFGAIQTTGLCGPEGSHIFVDLAWLVYACNLDPSENDDDAEILQDVVKMIVREHKGAPDSIWSSSSKLDALMRRQALAKYMANKHDTPLVHGAHMLLWDEDSIDMTNAFTAADTQVDLPQQRDAGFALWVRNIERKRSASEDLEDLENDLSEF